MSANMTEYGATRDFGYQNQLEQKAPTADGFSASSGSGRHNSDLKEKGSGPEQDLERVQSFAEGQQTKKFSRLGWKALTICLIVEAIALGSLSIPSAFATVGMVAGVIMCVGIGLVAIYTSYVVGQVKLLHPNVMHYADAVRLIWGRPGYELCSAMFTLFLVLLVGSHALTGTIAFVTIIREYGICALAWSTLSLIILFVVALPPTFHDVSILGYIDFVSIIAAILITMIATGIQAHDSVGGLSGVEWSAWPQPGTTAAEAFLAVTNIIFAYSFAVCQFSFMNEMHTPKDYVKSIWALGLIEIFIYTITGAVIYRFVGQDVKSPALLSAGTVVSRVAFGIGLPVIFISGSINGTTVGRYIMDRVFAAPHLQHIRQVEGVKGWSIWAALIATISIIGWIIAEAIPFFSALLGLISSLFISGFSFYFPALFWFQLVKEGKWNKDRNNILLSLANAGCLIFGVVTLVFGTYASVVDIKNQYSSGDVRGAFTCDSRSYL